MSENTAVAQSESTVDLSSVDPMLLLVAQDAANKITKANAIAEKYAASNTDEKKLVHEIREDGDASDENVQKFRAYKEQVLAALESATAKINAYITENLLPTRENIDPEVVKEEHKAAKKAATTALEYLEQNAGDLIDALREEYNVGDLKNLRGGSTSGGTGTGGKRPRVTDIWIDGESIQKDGKANFTMLANALKKISKTDVAVKDLQGAAFTAAKTEDLKSLDGEIFEFSFSAGDRNYMIRVQPTRVSEDVSEDVASEDVATEDDSTEE